MKVEKKIDNGTLTVVITGSVDTITAPQLTAEIDGSLEGMKELVFDFSAVDYVSSAGFRVLLMTNRKVVAGGGRLLIRGVQPQVREVFEMTGFSDIFTFD